MGALEAFGRSNVTQTLGIALRELRAGRMEELNAKKFEADQATQKQQMGMNVEAHGASMDTARQTQNINKLKLEELQEGRKLISVDDLRKAIGYGSEYLFRAANTAGLITDGYIRKKDATEFSIKFFSNTENVKVFRDIQFADAQAKLKKIDGYANIEDADAKKALLVELGVDKEKDLPNLRQEVATHVAGLKGAGIDLKDATDLFNKQSAGMREYLTRSGLAPHRVGGGGYVQYEQAVGNAIAEKTAADKQQALADEERKADIDLKRKIAEEERARINRKPAGELTEGSVINQFDNFALDKGTPELKGQMYDEYLALIDKGVSREKAFNTVLKKHGGVGGLKVPAIIPLDKKLKVGSESSLWRTE